MRKKCQNRTFNKKIGVRLRITIMQNSSQMFEIKIIPEVISLWDQLGISKDQRDQEIDTLTDSFRLLYNEFVSHLTESCQETREQITDYQLKHRQAMKAYGIPEDVINKQINEIQPKNLLKQLELTRQAYESFKLEISERVQKIENLIHMANELFDLFETNEEDRGEFSSLGEVDFTRERIDRFRAKIGELTEKKNIRQQKADKMKESINQLLFEMNTKLTDEDSETLSSVLLSDQQLERLNDLRVRYEKKKIQRVIEISELAVTITHLWDLLNIPDKERSEFLSSHSTLGDDVVASCHEEIEKLSKLRDQKLPELIAEQRQEVIDLWNLLHVAVESCPRFEDHIEGSETESEKNVREFKFLESEIIRLKKISVECHSLLESVNQREDIVNEYNEMLEATSDPHRLMSRGRGCAQQLMKEEKARRRFKITLPKLEKKLYEQLLQYKSKNGIDFEWDGKPYIEKLSHIKPEDIKPRKIRKIKANEDVMKCRTLPPSPRKQQFINNENIMNNLKSFSIRARSPIKM
ncbi:hypothetical protein TRFO_09956 [Tritrichomonas foetus]|uniref:Protein regulator of cytokinesis 1 n=1 Tax=Tritrichomonas foetus TaxID=1144522 RepID=A0A1J4JDG6_9EUKA|nr:hypothetical protein TRFO_09956 [Tritrichomonas foetus]|eukprot:OHS96327.1 hypothetical protein TRFO_09956 [Tritrichomonas foetus]